jgi:hypothetical protein
MIADAGFEVEGVTPPAKPAASATPDIPITPATPHPDLVHIRHRGPGTTLPANT